MVSNSQHFSLGDRKIKLQLDNPSESEPPNNGQAKRIRKKFIKLPWWRLSVLVISLVGIFRVGIAQVGIILGGNFPGGNCPGRVILGIYRVGVILGGSFLGGNCLLGIIQVAIFRVGVFMLPITNSFSQTSSVPFLNTSYFYQYSIDFRINMAGNKYK